MTDKPQRLARSVIYENPWVNLYIDRVQFPGGRIVEQHHLLDFEKQAVAAVVENEQGQILLVHAYRYTTNSIEWELPAGGIDPGETILEAARREVWEETGYESDHYELMYTYNPMNGISNKVFHVARGRAGDLTGTPDPNEVGGVRWFSRQELLAKIRSGELRDGFTLTGLLLHFLQTCVVSPA